MVRNSFQHRSPRRACRGFTLVELVVVVLILGILATIAASRMFHFSQDAEVTAMIAEKNVILSAIEYYQAAEGKLPGDQLGGDFPPELAPYLNRRVFTEHRPLTGLWDWSLTEFGVNSSLALVDWTPNLTLWAEIDEQYDDNDVDTGKIRTVNAYGGYFLVFVVDE